MTQEEKIEIGKRLLESGICRTTIEYKLLDDIVLATTTNSEDDRLILIAKKMKIKYFRGSENNVKERVLLASRKFSADIICQVTGDCPLIDPILVEQLINSYLINKKCAFVTNLEPKPLMGRT
jgi:spore coat polysaccharide biosynthesis protein SpsF (cytidylyltransferase family)